MPVRRTHKAISSSELASRGASVRMRNGVNNATGQPASNFQSNQITQREASDPERYRRMRQQRAKKLPFANNSSSYSNVGSAQGAQSRAGKYLDAAQGALGHVGHAAAGAMHDIGWRRALTWLRNGLLGLIAAYLIFVCFVSVKMNLGVDLVTRSKLSFAIPGQPYYTLLVGTDKSWDRVEAGETTYRTDSIILARVDPIGGKITLVSIQRDTKVDLDEYGTQKINAAYALGGAPLLIETVSELAGVPISNYAEIDFDSFVSVVDALGGIDVTVPIDINDEDAHINLTAGEQTLNGEQALGLCRARHAYDSYGSGDYYRTSNQRMVLGAILKKGLNGNPFNLISLIGAVSDSVSCTFLPLNITFLGLRFVGFDMSENLMSGLEPTLPSYENGVWWEVVDEEAWTTMMNRVNQGLSPYVSEADDPTAGVAGIT